MKNLQSTSVTVPVVLKTFGNIVYEICFELVHHFPDIELDSTQRDNIKMEQKKKNFDLLAFVLNWLS